VVDTPAAADLVIAVSPGGGRWPSPAIATQARRGGGLGVLDVGVLEPGGVGGRLVTDSLSRGTGPIGVRVSAACALTHADLDRLAGDRVDLVVLTADAPWPLADTARRYRVLVEVTSIAQARAAADAGAHGLIARAGELSSFVLLQQLLAQQPLPVWATGVGPRSAVAAVAGGAAGVVLDCQLALMPEADLPDELCRLLRRMDGSEPAADGPAGPDGWLAAAFRARWATTTQAVRAIRRSITDAVLDPPHAGPLAPGAPLATTLGIRIPVAQGPMTRVSDQPAFAAAVAADGALPFIALALADGPRSRQLLAATAAEMSGLPWGVGVLGFVPDELRTAQIAAIRANPPHYAIIAGGRPAQAAQLERDGIPTFLHVPSPGLLGQFLRSGSRRFVFEGAECGGHIGPRASFSLWEAQVAVLTEFLDGQPAEVPREVQIFFAGGVHDARSAAMVVALAAPLTARGVQIGVLMGTAYLFTDEAVRHGAVVPLFQRKLLAARRTALLQTAPGHVTRCLDSDFVAEFDRRRAELAGGGGEGPDAWQQLEALNIGRLRVAAKGRERDGTALDEATQSAAGLYMAGQVAALRADRTTVAALHAEVSTGATDLLAARCDELRERFAVPATDREEDWPAEPCDIAVIGMACAFPGSSDLDGFWHTILRGADPISEVPADRWDPATYYTDDPARTRGGRRVISKWGGFLSPLPIDPIRFGIPPAALASIDPGQLLALEIADRTLSDAGYRHDAPGADHSRTGVVFAAQFGGDVANATMLRTMLPGYLGEVPAELDDQLPTITEDTFAGSLPNVIAGRIANRLDLGGVNFTVDAACAASLASVDVACKELTSGAADLMLCGGLDIHNSIGDFAMFGSVQALSPTGRVRTFDSTADGTVLGEGVACVALKRLADAYRDGDRIYAVIKGVGSASDGRALGLTAPSEAGQVRSLRRAYRRAGVLPRAVGLVEAHGTGTVVGDRTELLSLTAMFAEHETAPGSCVLGSVKSQIGHTKNVAGLAGLIKAALAVYTGVQPPTSHLTNPNPAWDRAGSPFVFLTEPRPWLAPAGERVAGVSAFGFGGTNYHVVLQGCPETGEPRQASTVWPAELFTFRGADRPAALRAVQRTLDALDGRRLTELAVSGVRDGDPRSGPVRVAVVARDVDELAALLRRALAGEHDPAAGLVQPPEPAWSTPPKVALLFPGQGSQRVGALAELFVYFPEVRPYLALGRRWAASLLPPAAFGAQQVHEQSEALRDTAVAQPVLGIGALAVEHVLRRLGVEPAMAAGHSYGELAALCAAGAFDPATLLELSAHRATAILGAAGDDAGTMAAANAGPDQVSAALATAGVAGQIVLANHNAPNQVVISGPTATMGTAVGALREAGLAVRQLPVACAFHSPVVAAGGPAFARVLADRPISAPRLPVWSNRTAAPYPADAAAVRDELAAQIGAPVRFVDQIEAMYAAGARIFLEAGPGRVLSSLVDSILGDRAHLSVACDDQPGSGLRGLLIATGQLACAGVAVDLGWLVRGREAPPGQAATAHSPRWTVDGHLVRGPDGKPVPGGLRPVRRIKEQPMAAVPDRAALLAEYLRGSREQVAAQRDVMLAFLGVPEGSRPPSVPSRPITVVQTALAPAPQPAPTAVPAVPAQAPPADLETAVRTVISERTGYPVELIEADLDLEADLGIDSIKRAEMAGEVAQKMGIPVDGDGADFEELVKARTLRSIVELLTAHAPTTAESPAAPPAGAQPEALTGSIPQRLVPSLVAAPGTIRGAGLIGGTTFLVVGTGPSAARLADLLSTHGATANLVDTEPDAAGFDGVHGVILLDGLTATGQPAPPVLFPTVKRSLAGLRGGQHSGPRWLFAVGDRTLPRTAGLAGMFRTIHQEYPDLTARYLDLDGGLPPERVAELVVAELLIAEPVPVAVHKGQQRFGYEGVRAEFAPVAGTGAGPDGAGTALTRAIGLNRSSVVALIGGARGITSWFARELAAGCACRIVLAGRTPFDPAAEPDEFASITDLPGLRAALACRGDPPADIDRTARDILARGEVRATVADLRGMGSEVSYHTLDVRDEAAVGQFVKAVGAEHGRLDGVVYAAGVIEDRRIVDKDPASFNRVFATKVDGARALLAALSAEPPRFVVLFGSVSAAFGTPGQVDYAAANDALSTLGADWAAAGDRRCLTVHWGPWLPAGQHPGLVTPELARQYLRRGIELIDPTQGALSLLRELAYGDPSTTSVVYTAPTGQAVGGTSAE
jgi:acyl transferase domain-containing protein/NAD(P)H-dependent flavin oxidoreductase YrpB (nitropropane dioxygenase family)